MSESSKYIYGILDSSAPSLANLAELGLGKSKLELVTCKDISAVVSSWDEPEVALSTENLQAHNKVLAILMNAATVLPVEFGVVAPSSADILRMLKINYSLIARTIKSIHDKAEVNLRALWKDMKKIFEDIVKENPAIARFKKEIASQSFEKTYKDRILIGEMVAERLNDKKEELTEKIIGPLKKYASKTRLHAPYGDEMICNVVFLLEKNKISLFDESLEGEAKKYEEIHFKYIGPLPPQSFINLKLRV